MANFGDILSNLSIGASQSVRRNAGDSAFEAFSTLASGITIGASPIASGTDTRVLFQDGSVVGEDSGLTFDKTNDILSVGVQSYGVSGKSTLGNSLVNLGYSCLALQGGEHGANGLGTILAADPTLDPIIYFGNLVASGGFQFYNDDFGLMLCEINSTGVTTPLGLSASSGAFNVNTTGKLTIQLTTEQLRIGYNALNYYSTTVSSVGLVTYNAVGSGSAFEFSDQIRGAGTSGTVPPNARLWLRHTTDAAELLQMDRGNFGDTGYGFRWYIDDQGSFPSLRVTGGLNDTLFNVGAKYFGAGGVGGSGIMFANFVSGRGTQFGFASNSTDFVNQLIGSFTFVNDTANSGKKAGAQFGAVTEDLQREATGFELLTNQTPSSGYPTGCFYVDSQQTTKIHQLIVGGDGAQTQYYAQGYNSTAGDKVLLKSTNVIVEDTTLAGLGSDVVTNGSFTGSATGWTLGTGWAYNSNNVAKNAAGTGTLSQTVTTVAGTRYSLRITYGAAASGSTVSYATVTVGGQTMSPRLRLVGKIYEYTFTALGTSTAITITPIDAARFTIDDVQCKPISRGSLFVVNTLNVGNASASMAKANVFSTTEQLRVGYDTSNYYKTTVGSTGTVTFDAVGSGSGFAFSDPVNITSSLQCDSIVNDTGLAHGAYTPTLTGVANVSSSTARQATYMRVGNTVTVAGQIDVTPTANNTRTTIGISLPVASNFSTAYQAGGTAHTTANTTSGHGGAIYSDATNDRVELDYYETHGALDTLTYTFTYEVI